MISSEIMRYIYARVVVYSIIWLDISNINSCEFGWYIILFFIRICKMTNYHYDLLFQMLILLLYSHFSFHTHHFLQVFLGNLLEILNQILGSTALISLPMLGGYFLSILTSLIHLGVTYSFLLLNGSKGLFSTTRLRDEAYKSQGTWCFKQFFNLLDLGQFSVQMLET